ncbi:MAG: GSCFA domain-containing protein [Paludibacteraceae bacterium]
MEEISDEFNTLLTRLKNKIPALEVIFTVSPICHWKDGAHENNVSKAALHLSIENLCRRFSFVHYFPAYEIQMDELRDYRFYAQDMLHPSETAIKYIWQCFSETFFDKDTLQLKRELEQLRSDYNHRPMHPHTAEYRLFVENREKRKNKLLEKYPVLDNLLKNV